MNLRWLLIILFLLQGKGGHAQGDIKKYPFNFEMLKKFSQKISKNDTLIPVYKSGKFHFVNSFNNKVISKETFEEAYPFDGKYALVKKDSLYGIIDRNMNVIVNYRYQDPGYLVNGRPRSGKLPQAFSFEDGKFVEVGDPRIGEPGGAAIVFYKDNGKYYFVTEYDENGKRVRSEAVYDTSYVFNRYFALAKRNGKIGAIDDHGRVIVPFIYEDISVPNGFSSQSFASLFALKKDGQWHYFAKDKELFSNTVKPTMLYRTLFTFKRGTLINYFTKQGKVALPRNYKWIDEYGNIGIDAKGQVVLFNNKKEEFIYYTP